jgi:uncharacterized protein YwgA
MKLYEILLMLFDEFGGELTGRTRIQKLCYFYSILYKRDMGFRAHYYGPYSPQVEKVLDELEGIGLIEKNVITLGENSGGFEVKRYDYKINDYGKQVVNNISQSDEKQQLKSFVRKIKDVGNPNTTDISVAAKAYFVLARADMPLTDDEIRKKASAFDWDINSNSINKAADFLKNLELLKAG